MSDGSTGEDHSAEIEGGFDVRIAAQFKASLDGAESRREERESRLEKLIPTDTHIQGGGVAPASGDLIFSCGGPAMGRNWVLRRLAVGGTDPTAASVGSAYFFASSAGDEEQLLASGWFELASALPAVSFYSSRQVVIQPGQKIYCRIHTPTAGASYVVSGAAMSEIANEPVATRYTL